MIGGEFFGESYFGAGPDDTLSPGFITGGAALYAPTLTGGSVVIPASFIAASTQLFAPLMGPRLYAARDGSWNGNPATSDLYIIDPPTGFPISVGPIPWPVECMAFDPMDGTLYACTSSYSDDIPMSLITIDPFTGAGTVIGALALSPYNHIEGISFTSDGQMWGTGGDFPSFRKLYQIDKATAALTEIQKPSTFAKGSSPSASDAQDNIYTMQFDFDGGEMWIALRNGVPYPDGLSPAFSHDYQMQFSEIVDADEVLSNGGNGFAGFTFGPDGFAYAIDPYDDTVLKVTVDGNVTIVGGVEGTLDPGATDNVHDFFALAWLGEVKPNPWFAFPDFYQDFDSEPIGDGTETYSSPTPPIVSTDAYVNGTQSFKVHAESDDQYVDYLVPNAKLSNYGWPLRTDHIYVSTALLVPVAGAATFYADWISLGPDVFIYSNGDGTVKLRMQYNSDEFFSANFSEGIWHAIQIDYLANLDDLTDDQWQVEFIIDGVSSGVQVSTPGGGAASLNDLIIGDYAHGDGTALLYYTDPITWSMVAMPPIVDVSGAVFTGVGSGIDYDAPTGIATTPHSFDDSYTTIVDHPLTVPGNTWDPTTFFSFFGYNHPFQDGVLVNDSLATTASLNTGPSHGTLTYFNSDGSFQYVPDPGYVGTDSFVYNGDAGGDTATVHITIRQFTDGTHAVFQFNAQHGHVAAL